MIWLLNNEKRYYVSSLVNINIFHMTPQRATWKNSYYMLNVLPSLNKVLLLLLLLLLFTPTQSGESPALSPSLYDCLWALLKANDLLYSHVSEAKEKKLILDIKKK